MVKIVQTFLKYHTELDNDLISSALLHLGCSKHGRNV